MTTPPTEPATDPSSERPGGAPTGDVHLRTDGILDRLAVLRAADAPTHGGRVLSYVYDPGLAELDELGLHDGDRRERRRVEAVDGLHRAHRGRRELVELGEPRVVHVGQDPAAVRRGVGGAQRGEAVEDAVGAQRDVRGARRLRAGRVVGRTGQGGHAAAPVVSSMSPLRRPYLRSGTRLARTSSAGSAENDRAIASTAAAGWAAVSPARVET